MGWAAKSDRQARIGRLHPKDRSGCVDGCCKYIRHSSLASHAPALGVGWAAKDDRRGPLIEARRTEGRNEMEDCANANHVAHNALRELAQLRRGAAGLEGSAAHPTPRAITNNVIARQRDGQTESNLVREATLAT